MRSYKLIARFLEIAFAASDSVGASEAKISIDYCTPNIQEHNNIIIIIAPEVESTFNLPIIYIGYKIRMLCPVSASTAMLVLPFPA